MTNYKKPVVLMNEDLAEGVYAASGDCYSVSASVTQSPATGFPYYVVKASATHGPDGPVDHHSTAQVLTISFNKNVSFAYCNATYGCTLLSGDGTSTLKIQFNYHANQTEGHGLGDIYLNAAENDSGLEVTGAVLSCNYTCDQHDSLGNY